ncbi:neurochondrin [Dermacentor andersoni]|uniref:neurochondrin n=1 Tax=Dermacentor andersoni TaxID=34620 RepID=UPI00215544D9|nr:neurochondrin-like [Dermacentor andersoni]
MSSEERDTAPTKDKLRLLNSTLRALRSSTSDVEKLAALLVLTKAVDASSVQPKSKRKLLDAIGVPFIVRMLQSDTDTFRVLGADMTCAFAIEPTLCEPLRPALDALAGSLADLGIATGVECASRLVLHEPGCRALVDSGLLTALVELSPTELDQLGSLLTALATRLQSAEDRGSASDCLDEATLLSSARTCVGRSLTGKLGANARRGLFALLASLAERRGLRSLDAPTVALAAVELEMQLCSQGLPPDAELVANCCLLLEVAVDDAVASGNLPPRAADRVPGALLVFLDEAFQSPSWGPGQAAVLPACRLLCRWLADDSTTMRPEVGKVLAPLLDVVTSNEAMLPLIIPALCHLTADDTLRPIVLQSPLLARLFDYLNEWCALPQQLETCAGVFLNLAVLGAETLDSFPSLLDFCVQKAMTDTVHSVTLKANLALLGLFLLRSKLHRSIMTAGTLDMTAFTEHCTLLFSSSPSLPASDVEEWNELSSLGKQMLADVLPILNKSTLRSGVCQK